MKSTRAGLKVLLISPLPPPSSGIGSWTVNVTKEAAKSENLKVIVLDTAVRWRAVDNLSPIIRLTGGSVQAIRDILRTFAAIIKHKPAVIHLNTSASFAAVKDISILWLAKRFGIKSVIHYHMGRLPELIKKNNWEWRLIRKSMMLADKTIVLTRESENCIRKAEKSIDVVLVPNPVDISDIKVTASDVKRETDAKYPRIVFAGHVTESKGVTNLISACTRLPVDFTLDIVGPVTNQYKEQLREIAKERDDGNRFVFHGEVTHDQAIQHIASADILVLPSLTEAFPYVVVEAMACGVPVVGTRVGAVPDMLDVESEHPCGVCVAPGDVDSLAQALSLI
ncbi:MAG TPA: glycosyltransferase family 4 protein, partial [Armatimonadota bacterium]|nr:glycosyltransferase family 4 protein [Armatimonadota bacterium]